MTTILHGNIIHAPSFGALETVPNGYLILEDGVLQTVSPVLPEQYAACPVTDYGDTLIMPSFADLHLHAPQYPMLGMGMDLPLLAWLETYTFPVEARFQDPDFARVVYRALAEDLISSGTTRVSAFSSRHTASAWGKGYTPSPKAFMYVRLQAAGSRSRPRNPRKRT